MRRMRARSGVPARVDSNTYYLTLARSGKPRSARSVYSEQLARLMSVPARIRRISVRTWLLGAALPVLLTGLWAQRPFREYIPMEGRDSEAALPPDYQNKAELVLGRLMYPSGGGFGRGGGRGGNWLNGGTNWTVDYPRGDRTFAVAIRRLGRIDVRSVEQPVNPDDGDEIYYWPYLHVGMPTNWNLTDAQAAKIREYLLRGGFMLCDSFFGTQERAGFVAGMNRIFPDREIVDPGEEDAFLHTGYDVKERYQVGNFRSMLRNGKPCRGGRQAVLARSARRQGPGDGGHHLQ